MMISIIMPVYNCEKTIERAIKSVIAQTSSAWELVIVDGKSLDSTMDVVGKYSNQISVIISESDKGYADALNKGIKAATGDYIMMLAGDDWILPNAIENFLSSVKDTADVWCGTVIQKMPYGYRLLKSDPDLNKLRKSCSLEFPASFCRRDLFEKFGGFDTELKCAADREMFLRFYTQKVCFQIEQIPTVVFEMGGLSTGNPEKYGLPEDEMVSSLYGLSEEEITKATAQHRKLLSQEKKRAPIKLFFSRIGLLKLIYRLAGKSDGCLTDKMLINYGMPKSMIHS